MLPATTYPRIVDIAAPAIPSEAYFTRIKSRMRLTTLAVMCIVAEREG